MEFQKSNLKYMYNITKGTEFNADLKFKWDSDFFFVWMQSANTYLGV